MNFFFQFAIVDMNVSGSKDWPDLVTFVIGIHLSDTSNCSINLLIQVSLPHWNLLIISHINFQDLRVSLDFLFAVNLCSNPEDKLQIYRDNFEKAYLDSTERFYRTQAPSYLQQNGVQNYMKYVSKNSVVALYWMC